MILDVAPGLTLRTKTGGSPVFFSHFPILVFGSALARLYNHNLGRIPRITLFGDGRTPAKATALIIFVFTLPVDSNFISAPVYSFSPLGKFLVPEHAVMIRQVIEKKSLFCNDRVIFDLSFGCIYPAFFGFQQPVPTVEIAHENKGITFRKDCFNI